MGSGGEKSSGSKKRSHFEWYNLDLKKLQAEGKLVRCELPRGNPKTPLEDDPSEIYDQLAAEYKTTEEVRESAEKAAAEASENTAENEWSQGDAAPKSDDAAKSYRAAAAEAASMATDVSDDARELAYRTLEPGERELYEAFDGSPPPCKIPPITVLKPHEKENLLKTLESSEGQNPAQNPSQNVAQPEQNSVCYEVKTAACEASKSEQSDPFEPSNETDCGNADCPDDFRAAFLLDLPSKGEISAAAERLILIEAEYKALSEQLKAAREELLDIMRSAGLEHFSDSSCSFKVCPARTYFSLDVKAIRERAPELFDELYSSYGLARTYRAQLRWRRKPPAE